MEDAGIRAPQGAIGGDVDHALAAAARKVAALESIAQAVAASDELETVLRGVASTIGESLGFPECNIYEYNDGTGSFRVLAAFDGGVAPADEWVGRMVDYAEIAVGAQSLITGRPAAVHSRDDPQLGDVERRLMESYGEHVLLTVPMYFAGRRVGVIELVDTDPRHRIGEDDVSLAQAMANQAVAAIQNAKSLDSLRSFHLNSLSALASALNAKDTYTHGHASRVAAYAVFLCRELGIDERLTAELEKACYLHDIGKIGVTDRILQKRGRLNLEERALMQTHAGISARIIEPLFSGEVVEAVRHHHEAWNGSGYPDGLHGDEIPLLARLMHIVDSYDAMSYSRPYARARGYAQAVEEIRRGAGVHFDPDLVEPFLSVLARMQERRLRVAEIAQEAASLIDGDEHSRLVAEFQEDSPVYREMVATLRRVRAAHPEVRYITTAVLRDDTARFVLDAEEDPELRSRIGDPYPYFLDSPRLADLWQTREASASLYEHWFGGEENVLYVDEWGIWLCGSAVIYNRRGEAVGVVNVDVPALEMDPTNSGAQQMFNALMHDVDLQLATSRVLEITDELSGLYNHRFFHDQLAREIVLADEELRTVCVLLIDLVGFAKVNEARGYAHGDLVIHSVGQRLAGLVLPEEVCARIVADRFGVITTGRDVEHAAALAGQIQASLAADLAKAGEGIDIAIGVAAYPDHGITSKSLVMAAEQVLRRAKRPKAARVAVAEASV